MMRAIKNYIKMSLLRMLSQYIFLVLFVGISFLVGWYFFGYKPAYEFIVRNLTDWNYFLLWLPLVVGWIPFKVNREPFFDRALYNDMFGVWRF